MARMRGRGQSGLSLVETLLAMALLVFVAVIATDALVDVLYNRNQENLSHRINQEVQRILDQMTGDINSAGFRLASPGVTFFDSGGNAVLAFATPAADVLEMRCVTGMGQLSADADAGATALVLQGFNRLPSVGGGLLLNHDGITEYKDVSSVDQAGLVGLASGLARKFPAGAIVAAVDHIRYEVVPDEAQLIRSVNGAVQARLAVDLEDTAFTYTLKADTDGDGNDNEGEMVTKSLLDTGDLNDLLTVNIVLRLTRAAAGTRGLTINNSQTVSQRIKPLNLGIYFNNPDDD